MNKLNEQATPEEISTRLNELIPKVKENKSSYRNDSAKELGEIVSHPNFSKQNFDQVYSSFSSPEDLPFHHEIVEKLSNNQNWNPGLAQQTLGNLSQAENIPHSFVQHLSEKHPDLDFSPLEQRAIKDIENKDIETSELPNYTAMNFKPDFYFNLLNTKPEHTLGDELSEDQKNINKKALKHSFTGLTGLINTQKHTPESLQQTLDLLMDKKVNKLPRKEYYRFDKDDEHQFDSLEAFVKKQKGLSKDQLSAIYEKASQRPEPENNWGHSHDDLPEAILQHKNVDPMLLAKVARSAPRSHYDSKLSAALSNPQLPHEVINGILQNDEELIQKAHELSQNPSLTKEQLNTLADKGYAQKAIEHENSDEELHKKVWENTDKSTDAARAMLKSDNLPPSILSEIVNHKNKNVAIDALRHKNVNEDVLNTALNRKMKDVQDAARKHPLVADKELKKGFLEGKVKLSSVLTKKQENEHFSKLTPEEKTQAYEKFSEKLKGTNFAEIEKNSKEDPKDIFKLKYHLATSPEVPESIRKQHADDIVESFDIPHNSTDFSFGYNEAHKAKYNAFNGLVEQGNKKAEEAALGKIGYLMNLNTHFRDERQKQNISPSFLNNAFEKVANSAGQNLLNNHGFPSPIEASDITESLKEMAKFPGLSEENFDKYLNQDPQQSHSQRYLYHSRHGRDGTLLDARYRSLPEDEKRQKYGKYLNPVQAFAVAASNDAPQDMKDQAFEMLTPQERHELVNYAGNNMVGFSSGILKNALLGKYDNPDQNQTAWERSKNDGASSYERNALNLLDEKDPEHIDVLDAYLTFNPDRVHKTSDTGIAKELGDSWLTEQSDLFKKHSVAHPDLYFKSVDSVLKKQPGQLWNKSKEEKESIKNYMANYLQKEAEDYSKNFSNPDEGKTEFWGNILRKYGKGYESNEALGIILGHSDRDKTSNGKLDFLADLGKKDKDIKQLLLSKNILSKPKQEELASTFSNYGEYLDSLSSTDKNRIINRKLQSLKSGEEIISNEDAEHVLTRLNAWALSGSAELGTKTKRMPEEKFNLLNENFKTVHDLASNTLSSRALTESVISRTLSELKNPKDKEAAGLSILSHILQTSDEGNKSDKVNVFYRGVKDSGTVPTKVLGMLADYASENNDIKTLTNLYKENENVPKSVSTKITKLIQNSKTLDPQEILDLASLYDHEKFTAANIKKLDFAFEQSLQKNVQSDSEAAILRESYLQKLSEAESHPEPDKAQFFASVLQKYMTFPETRKKSIRMLRGYLRSDSLPDKDKKNIYLNLPDQDPSLGSSIRLPILSRNLANDSEILERSTEGWKLDSLIKSMDNMNGNSLSVLVNRVVLHEDPERFASLGRTLGDDRWKSGKDYILDNLMKNSASRQEDITKLIRSLPEEEISNFVDVKSTSRQNFLEGHVAPLLNHLTEKLSDMADNPSKYPGIVDSESLVSELSSKVKTLSKVVFHSEIEDDMTTNKELLETYSNSIKTICNANHKILDSKIENETLINESLTACFDSLERIKNNNIPMSGDDLTNTFSVLKKIQAKPTKADHSKILNTYTELIKKSENVKPEVWKQLASEHPEYPYFFQNSNINKSMLDALDVEKHLDKEPDLICSEMKEWFHKMDDEALKNHGLRIVNAVMKAASPDKKMSMNESSVIHEGLKFGSRFMDSESVKQILKKLPDLEKKVAENICIEHGTGGQDLINELFQASLTEDNKVPFEQLTKFIKSPMVTDKMADIAMESFDSGSPESDAVIEHLMKNKYTSGSIVDSIAGKALDEIKKVKNLSLLNEIVKHPKISYEKAKEIYESTSERTPSIFAPGKKFHPIFLNPTHGSRFLRDLPAHVPVYLEQYGISANKMQRDILVEGKGKEKIYNVIRNIPAEGIAWPEFKRKFPKYENVQEIKSVFMGKNNKPAFPEDFTGLLAQTDEKDKFNSFHVTFSYWDSNLQVHSQKALPNLVVQLNTSQKADEELSKDPKVWSLYQHILKHSNGIGGRDIGLHPTTPHLISWSRVDTSNKDAWIIEEFQSDVAQKFRKNLKNLLKNSPAGLQLDGQLVTPEEIKKSLGKIDEAFSNWQKASMQAVLENAKSHGIKRVYIHGHGIRSKMSGSGRVNGISGEYNKNHINPRIVEIYDGTAEKYGFKKCDYTDYPNYNSNLLSSVKKLGLPTHCWYLDIA